MNTKLLALLGMSFVSTLAVIGCEVRASVQPVTVTLGTGGTGGTTITVIGTGGTTTSFGGSTTFTTTSFGGSTSSTTTVVACETCSAILANSEVNAANACASSDAALFNDLWSCACGNNGQCQPECGVGATDYCATGDDQSTSTDCAHCLNDSSAAGCGAQLAACTSD